MKASEVHKLSDEEIKAEVERLRKRRYEGVSQAVTEKLDNPAELRGLRRDIARLLTEKRARQQKQEKA